MTQEKEDYDPIMGSVFKGPVDEEELEQVKKLVGFENFSLSDKPICDMKRKIALARILPLLLSGFSYEEIGDKLNIAKSTVYQILKLYYRAVDQNELVDVYWWGLFFYMRKNKPEVAFNALTQIKLKKMSLNVPTNVEEIVITWMKHEQNDGSNNSVLPASAPVDCAPEQSTVQNDSQRKALGQNDLGS